MSDYTEHLISQAGGDGEDDAALARAILNRRRRKCVAERCHVDGGCARCGL